MVHTDTMHVIHVRAAGLDVHKMRITATVRLARPWADAETRTRTFSALPSGLEALSGWLLEHEAGAAVMEATGIYWEAPYEAPRRAGIEVPPVHARHVKQIKGRKTDIELGPDIGVFASAPPGPACARATTKAPANAAAGEPDAATPP